MLEELHALFEDLKNREDVRVPICGMNGLPAKGQIFFQAPPRIWSKYKGCIPG